MTGQMLIGTGLLNSVFAWVLILFVVGWYLRKFMEIMMRGFDGYLVLQDNYRISICKFGFGGRWSGTHYFTSKMEFASRL